MKLYNIEMMKRMEHIFCLISILVLSGLTTCTAGEPTVESIRDMMTVMQQATLEDFLQAVEANGWKAPVIYSLWHVEQIATEEEWPVRFEARVLGRILAERLVDWKTLMMADTSPAQLQQDIERFFTLTDWLTKSRGYGNLFLAARCHDITTVGIGRLLVNLEYPLETTVNLLNTLDAPPWNAPSVRQQILNQEAGVELFVTASTQEKEIQSSLKEIWDIGEIFIRVQETPDVKAAIEGNPPKGKEWLVTPSLLQMYRQASPLIQEHAEFFKDDGVPAVVTTLSMWDRKWHQRCVTGFGSYNAHSLKALVTFRATVGYFPTEPKYEDDFYRSRIEAAFAQVWRENYATHDTWNLDAPASAAYEAIITGRFLDADTRAEMLAGQ